MMREFVNQRDVDGLTYRAWRDAEDPSVAYVERGGTYVQVDLRAVWSDDAKLRAVFDGR